MFKGCWHVIWRGINLETPNGHAQHECCKVQEPESVKSCCKTARHGTEAHQCPCAICSYSGTGWSPWDSCSICRTASTHNWQPRLILLEEKTQGTWLCTCNLTFEEEQEHCYYSSAPHVMSSGISTILTGRVKTVFTCYAEIEEVKKEAVSLQWKAKFSFLCWYCWLSIKTWKYF